MAAKKPSPKPEVRTQIRIPAKLHAALAKAAQANRRSLNSEMLVRLEASLNP